MVSIKPEARITPAYAPWPTFKSFIETLKATAIPSHIDPSVMGRMSGSVQSQLRTTLRFLNLIDDSGAVTAGLRKLVGAFGTEDWKESLGDIVFDAYADLLGDFDIRS